MATKTTEHTGGSSSYYTVEVKQPVTEGRKPYVAECLDIAEALELNIAEFNIFKAIWRTAAERQGKAKAGNNAKYDAEKIAFFAQRMLVKHNTGETTSVDRSIIKKVYDAHERGGLNPLSKELEGNYASAEEDQIWFDNNPLLPEHLKGDNLLEVLEYLPADHPLRHPKGNSYTEARLLSNLQHSPIQLARDLSKARFVWNSTEETLELHHVTNVLNPKRRKTSRG